MAEDVGDMLLNIVRRMHDLVAQTCRSLSKLGRAQVSLNMFRDIVARDRLGLDDLHSIRIDGRRGREHSGRTGRTDRLFRGTLSSLSRWASAGALPAIRSRTLLSGTLHRRRRLLRALLAETFQEFADQFAQIIVGHGMRFLNVRGEANE